MERGSAEGGEQVVVLAQDGLGRAFVLVHRCVYTRITGVEAVEVVQVENVPERRCSRRMHRLESLQLRSHAHKTVECALEVR